MKPRALDLFCGAGGATRGLQQAGFHVTGVDLAPQPRYVGDKFHQADAMEFPLEGYDLIWASPPCQSETNMSNRWRGKGTKADAHPKLIGPTRARLLDRGGLWVIENVTGARGEMRHTVMLHGGMFGLGVHRPRLFEASFLVLVPQARRAPDPIGVYGEKADGRRLWTRRDGEVMRAAKSVVEGRAAMGIDWMEWSELKESIPPAYSRWIGEAAMRHLCLTK